MQLVAEAGRSGLGRDCYLRSKDDPIDCFGVDSHPVDFVALRVEPSALASTNDEDLRADTAVWLYRSPEDQALMLSREDAGGALWLRYLPVSNLAQDADGRVRFERAAWRDFCCGRSRPHLATSRTGRRSQ